MREDFERAPPEGPEISQLPALDIDPAKYASHVAHFDMTEAQQMELLRCLLIIVRGFVELGFTGNICEQIFGDSESASPPSSGDVKSLGNN